MCATNNVELNSTASRSIQISLKHYGDDPRYSMWSHDAGNGMTIKVNEANGNLFLDVPFDSLATAIGDLSFGVNYNSQENVDYGLTGGWSLDIGPSSSRRDVPLELVKLQPFPDAGVKIRLKGNRPIYFPHRDRKVFASVGPGTGVVKQNADDTFLLDHRERRSVRVQRGWQAPACRPGRLGRRPRGLRVRLRLQRPGRATVGDRSARPCGHVQLGQQPPGHAVDLDGGDLDLQLHGRSPLAVSVNVTNPSTGQTQLEKVAFEYNGAGNVSEVDNGARRRTTGRGGSSPTSRIRTVFAGSRRSRHRREDSSTTPTPWTFEYYGPYIGTTATYACITDPHGTPGGAPCNAAHKTKVDFNTSGLPIGITGPADQTGYLPVTTMIWGLQQQHRLPPHAGRECGAADPVEPIAANRVPGRLALDQVQLPQRDAVPAALRTQPGTGVGREREPGG